MEFIETFPYVIHYKQGKENIVADALSRRYVLISILDDKFLGFEYIKELLPLDQDFSEECAFVKKHPIAISLYMRGSCFGKISCAFLIVPFKIC